MLISRISRKRYKVANKAKRWRRKRIRDHTSKPIRLMKTVAVDIRSYVAMMTNIANQSKHIEVKRPFTNSWKRCSKRLNTAVGVIKKRFNKPLKMTDNDEICFKLMDKCHICDKEYTDKDVCVRDHCHITGKFRLLAHQECNLKLSVKPEDIKIPIIFHNL